MALPVRYSLLYLVIQNKQEAKSRKPSSKFWSILIEESDGNFGGRRKNRSIIVALATVGVGVACIPHSRVCLAAFRSILSLCIPSAEVTASPKSNRGGPKSRVQVHNIVVKHQ